MTCRSGLRASEDRLATEREILLEKLNCYKMNHEQLKCLTLENDAAIKAMFTCLLDMKKKIGIIKTKNGLRSEWIAELLASAGKMG